MNNQNNHYDVNYNAPLYPENPTKPANEYQLPPQQNPGFNPNMNQPMNPQMGQPINPQMGQPMNPQMQPHMYPQNPPMNPQSNPNPNINVINMGQPQPMKVPVYQSIPVTLPYHPIIAPCSNCGYTGQTVYRKELSAMGILVIVLLLIFIFPIALCILCCCFPCLTEPFNIGTHTCAKCGACLGKTHNH